MNKLEDLDFLSLLGQIFLVQLTCLHVSVTAASQLLASAEAHTTTAALVTNTPPLEQPSVSTVRGNIITGRI